MTPTYPSILRNSFPGHLDGFERTLSVLSSRVRVSHPSERQLLSDLDILLHIVSQQRQYCVNLSYFALHEEDEKQSTTRVGVRIVRSGVGRPRLDISEDLLEALLCNSWISLGCHRGGGTNLGLLAQHRPLLT